MSPKIRLLTLAGTALATCAASAQSLDQTRAYAAEVMADAQQRTSLLGSAAASPPSQFGFSAANGAATLNISGWHQSRFTVTFLDDDGGAQDDFETGFSTPDTTFIFDGSVVSPDTTWKIEVTIDETGGFSLKDGYIAQDFGNGTSGMVGQFTSFMTRETMNEDNQLQFIERTITDSVFGGGQTQGVAISFTDEGNTWRVTGSFNDGARTAGTAYNDPNDGDFGLTVRADIAFEGQVDPYYATTRLIGGGDAMILGGYFNFQQNADQPGSDDQTIISAGVDFLMDNSNGWNFFAAGHLAHVDDDAAADEFLHLGLVLQGGYFVSDNTEVFAGWDMVIPDDDSAADADPFNTITVGLNHFPFAGTQAVRLSAAVAIFLDATTETGDLVGESTNNGLLNDSEGGQFSFMGMAQVTW